MTSTRGQTDTQTLWNPAKLRKLKITSTSFPACVFRGVESGGGGTGSGAISVTVGARGSSQGEGSAGWLLNAHIQCGRFTRELKGMLHSAWCRARCRSHGGRVAAPRQAMAVDSPTWRQLLSTTCSTANERRHMMSGKGNGGVKCLAKGYAASHDTAGREPSPPDSPFQRFSH